MTENANINYGEMIAVADLGKAGITFAPDGMLAIQGWVDINKLSQTSDSNFALPGFNSLKEYIQSEVTRLFDGIDGAATEAFYAIDYEIVYNKTKNTFSISVGGSAEWQDWVFSNSFLAAGSIPPAIDYMMMVGGVVNNYVNDLKSAGLISLDTKLVSAAHSLGASSVQAIAIATGTFAIGFEPAGIANEIDSIQSFIDKYDPDNNIFPNIDYNDPLNVEALNNKIISISNLSVVSDSVTTSDQIGLVYYDSSAVERSGGVIGAHFLNNIDVNGLVDFTGNTIPQRSDGSFWQSGRDSFYITISQEPLSTNFEYVINSGVNGENPVIFNLNMLDDFGGSQSFTDASGTTYFVSSSKDENGTVRVDTVVIDSAGKRLTFGHKFKLDALGVINDLYFIQQNENGDGTKTSVIVERPIIENSSNGAGPIIASTIVENVDGSADIESASVVLITSPNLPWSIQRQNLSFDNTGLLTSFNSSYFDLDQDTGIERTIALASISLAADGSLQGGFTEINGLQLGIDVQVMLDDLNFGPTFIGDEAVKSAMENLGTGSDLINQFNDWALQNGDPSLLVINTDVDTSNWSATLTSADGSSNKTLTPTFDANGQVTDFELVFIDGFPVTIDGGLDGFSEETKKFIIETEYKIQKDAANNWVQEKIDEQYRFDKLIVEAGVVGSIFGSSLSSLVSPNNALENVAVSTIFGLVGKELFRFAASAIDGKAISTSLDAAFGNIGLDLKSAGKGAISSFLTAELFNALNIGGVVGDIANTAGGAVISAIVENFGDIANSTVSISDVINGVDGAEGIQFGNIIGSYLGSKLASQIISFDTIGGQIGASAGAGLTSFFAGKAIGNGLTSLFGNLGAIGGPLGFAVGAFVGFIVGGLVGSLFGGTPRSGADVLFNPDTGEFGVSNVWSKKGGSKQGAENLASIAAANLNGILTTIGGTVVNEGRLPGGTYGTRKSDYTYRVDGGSFGPGDPGKQTIAKTFDGDNPEATTLLIEHGVLNALDDLQIAGGDVFLKRALYGSLDTLMTGSNVKASIQGEAINVILGNFQTAADYRTYIENAATINALIAAQPESALTAGWIITLQRVSEIGLNKRNVSDWLGGYNAWAVSNEVQSLGALSINPYINSAGQSDRRFILTDQNGFTRRIYDTVTQSSKDVISGTLGADIITITSDVLTGNAAFTINGAVSDGSNFQIDIAAMVRGGGGDDVITGGDLGNDLFGDLGNDTITGGAKDDWIFGGAGNDKLYAGGGSGNYLSGDAGDDELYGATGSDWLDGGSGIDVLRGNAGDDVLSGGAGAGDLLYGGSGDDSYILRLGDGADIIEDKAEDAAPTVSVKTIIDERTSGLRALNWAGIAQPTLEQSKATANGKISGGQDTLILGQGIGVGDISIARSGTVAAPGNDLIVKIRQAGIDTGDQVTLTNWFDDYQRIEKLQFSDGQTINIGNFATFTVGTDGADYIIGTSGNDFVHGGQGNDIISLLAGQDVGIGGTGNDYIAGDSGQDIIIGGDQDDVVQGGSGNDMVSGGRHDDKLYGGSGNDVLAGDEGNDRVVGGSGDDVFKYGRGDGKDIIFDEWNPIDPISGSNAFQTVWTSVGGFANGFSQSLDTGVITASDGTVIYDGDATGNWIGNLIFDRENGNIKYRADNFLIDTTDSGNDTLEFDVGIDINDIQMVRDGDDLILGIEGFGQDPVVFDQITDQITLKEWNRDWGAGGKPIENFSFFNTGKINTAEIDVWGGGGTDGNDNIMGGFDKDWLTGNGGDDQIDGLTGDDIINGNAGQDILIGGAGDDILMGGSGNDILRGDLGQDILVGGAGNDIISYAGAAGAVNVSLDDFLTSSGEAANDSFFGVEGITGTDFNDTLGGDQNANALEGGKGDDTLYGQLGDDSYVFNRGDGNDQIFEYQNTTETVVDSQGNLQSPYKADWNLIETNGFDAFGGAIVFRYLLTITNEAGDVVYSNEVISTEYGGIPNQLPAAGWISGFTQSGNGQEVTRTLVNSTDGGDDVLEFGENISLSNLTFAINGSDLTVTVDNAGGSVTINNFAQDYARIETLQLNDGLTAQLGNILINGAGTVGDDFIVGDGSDNILGGGDGKDILSGGVGADQLSGGLGDDIMEGGIGADALDGGDGVDTVRYNGSSAGVTVDISSTAAGSGGEAQGDTFISIENVSGSDFADQITGNLSDNRLFGLKGDDTLSGGAGNDVLKGDQGNDILSGDAGEDNLFGGEGNDTLSGGTEKDILFGDSGDDILRGDAGTDSLYGGDGNDTLEGGDDNDVLYGGTGTDTLKGDLGDDIFLFGKNDGADIIIDASGANEIAFDAGEVSFDQLWFAKSGNDLIIQVVGGDTQVTLQDYYTGGTSLRRVVTGTHSLSGDQMDDLVQVMAGQTAGTTSAEISETSTSVWQDNLFYVDRYVIEGADSANTLTADTRVGDFYISSFGGNDTINGSEGNDTLIGGTGWDILNGNGGNDTFITEGFSQGFDRFNGGLGFDVVLGGDGDDLIYIMSMDSIERFDGGTGYNILTLDTYESAYQTIDFRNIELVNIDKILGQYYDDTIYANNDDNVIEGGRGEDRLYGEGGNDTFIVEGTDQGFDRFYGGQGYDTILGGDGDDLIQIYQMDSIESIDGGAGYNIVSTTGYTSTETLDLRNINVLNIHRIEGRKYYDTIYGTEFGDIIDGKGRDDNLYGEGGDDVLIGGTGADKFYGGAGSDTVDLSTDSTTESVIVDLSLNKITWSDGILETLNSIENIVGTINNDTITGDANDNILDGDAGNDEIWGGAGNDTLIGGDGQDIFHGGAGIDTVDFSSFSQNLNIDLGLGTISSSVTTETVDGVENIIGGTGNDTLKGDGGDNELKGGAGNDTLDGGNGTDIAVFSGNRADYLIQTDSQTGDIIVTDNNIQDGDEGQDVLKNIQFLKFADQTVDQSGQNTAPVLNIPLNDQTISEDQAFNFVVPGNTFLDANGNALSYTASFADGSAIPVDHWLKFDALTGTFTGTPDNGDVGVISVKVKVSDGQYTAEDIFDVTVNNVNDVPTSLAFSGTVAEDAASGTIVGTASASDVDAGDVLTYALSDSSGLFEINSATGVVTVKAGAVFDFESSNSYLVNISVTDSAGASVNLNFPINVINVNEVPTALTFVGSVAENSGTGTIVGTATFTDPDAGDVATYSMTDPSGLFQIDSVTGVVSVKAGANLDFETMNNYSVNITATDSGGLFIAQNFVINITDQNEAPTSLSFSGTVAENSIVGTVVGTAAATDPDAGDVVSYSMTDPSGLFVIDSVTGEVTVAAGATLNFENMASYTINITAQDGNGGTVAQNFTINVTDVNEAPFGLSFSGSVIENAVPGTVVGTASASDMDAGDILTYALTDPSGFFEIDSATGEVKVKAGANLDYEVTSLYPVTVKVTDSGAKSVEQSYNITVTDENDAPTDITLTGSLNIDENVAGQILGSLSVTDQDSNLTDFGQQSLKVFEVIVGVQQVTESARFEIVGGQLKLKDGVSLNYESGETSITLAVEATDRNGAGKSYTKEFTVNVMDKDDYIYGTAGNDPALNGEQGTDYIFGRAGNDVLSGNSGNDYLYGEAGNDTLYGGTGIDRLEGGGGVDTLFGGDNADILLGGLDNDRLYGQEGNDLLQGDAGDDTLYGGNGNDTLYGGADNDTLYGGAGVNLLDGNDGDDTFVAGSGVNQFIGGTGSDTVDYSTSTAINVDMLANVATDGFAAGDTYSGIETIIGTSGADMIKGDNLANSLYGGALNDVLYGDGGNDTLYGDDGDDTIYGGAGIDVIYGGKGMDTLYGEGDSDTLYGGEGNDTLYGGDSSDILYGGAGDDTIFAGDAGDHLYGDLGNDILNGGGGNDVYHFTRSSGSDIINNYDADLGFDQIGFSLDISKDNLWFEKDGRDVVIKVLGTTTEIRVTDWYDAGGTPQQDFVVNLFVASADVSHSIDVDSMIGIMATYSANNPGFDPASSGTNIPTSIQASIYSLWTGNTPPSVTNLAPDVSVNEDNGQVTVVFNVSDAESTADALTIENITSSNQSLIQDGSLSYTNVAGLITLTFMPVANAKGTADIRFEVSDSGLITAKTFQVTVNAVADAPNLTVTDVSGNEGAAIVLDITAQLTDITETLEIDVSGVPAGASLNLGQNLGGGIWRLTAAQLAGLTLTPALDGTGTDINLTVTARSKESNGSQAETIDQFLIKVNGTPTVGNQSFSVNENVNMPTVVGTVVGYDPDSAADNNGTKRYYFSGGLTATADGLFSINSITGVVSTAANLDYESLSGQSYRYQYTLEIRDNAGVNQTDGNYLSDTATLTININDVNEAPVLNVSYNPVVNTINEDVISATGTSVSSMVVNGSITDPDGGAVEAIAITSVNNTYGTWEYRIGTGIWQSVGAVSSTNALLLDTGDSIRFKPNADYNGSIGDAISFKAWDKSSSTAGGRANATAGGGSSAFSLNEETVSITVSPVNDAPELNGGYSPVLSTISEDDTANGGTLISDLVVNGSITDRDGNAVESIALTYINNTNGAWQYKIGAGAWTNVNTVSASNALLLGANDRLRFIPGANYNGTVSNAISFKAWDQTTGAAGTWVDASVGGNGTAFSVNSDNASIAVVNVNDAPNTPTADNWGSITENTASKTLNVIANDTDRDPGASLDVNDAQITSGLGSLSISGDNITYSPGSAYNSLAAGETAAVTIRYRSKDQFGAISGSYVSSTLTITGVNDAPNTPTADTWGSITEDTTSKTLNVIANDADPDNFASLDVNDAQITSGLGSLSISGDNITYNSGSAYDSLAAGETAVVTIRYRSKDQFGAISGNYVSSTLTITGVNDAPVAGSVDLGASQEDSILTISSATLLQNTTDIDSLPSNFSIQSLSLRNNSDGAVVNNGNGTWSYTPQANYSANNILFDFTVNDGQGGLSSSTATLDVTPVNDAPDAPTASWLISGSQFNENAAVYVATLTRTDVDGTAPNLELVTGGAYFEIKNGNELWSKAVNYEANSSVSVSVRARDTLNAASAIWSKTFTVVDQNEDFSVNAKGNKTVQELIEDPSLNADEGYLTENDVPGNVLVDVNVSDPDSSTSTYGQHKFSFLSGTSTGALISRDGRFRINAGTGQVTLVQGNDYEAPTDSYSDGQGWNATTGQYKYKVVVKDNNGNGYTHNTDIFINLSGIDEIPVLNSSGGLGKTGNAGTTIVLGSFDVFDPEGSNNVTVSMVSQNFTTELNTPTPQFNIAKSSTLDPTISRFTISAYIGSTTQDHIGNGTITFRPFDGQFSGIDVAINVSYLFNGVWSNGIPVPVALDLDGDGIELVSVNSSSVSMDVDDDGIAEQIGWISADDAWLALDKDGNGSIDQFNEISFVQDTFGANTDLEGLQSYDTNGNGLLDVLDDRFAEFQVWQDVNSNGISEAGELKSLTEAGIRAIELTPISTGNIVEGATDNVITGTSRYLTIDGEFGIVGDVGLGFIDDNGQGGNLSDNGVGNNVLTPIVFDLKADGLDLYNFWKSDAYFDVDNDGDRELTGWVGASDAILALDRNENGFIDNGSEISFSGDVQGAKTDLEGLAAYDSNADGVLDIQDDRFADFLVWQDSNQNGISEASELKSLLDMDITSINLEPSTTGSNLRNSAGNIVFNTSEYTRADGSTALIGDVGLRFNDKEFIEGEKQENTPVVNPIESSDHTRRQAITSRRQMFVIEELISNGYDLRTDLKGFDVRAIDWQSAIFDENLSSDHLSPASLKTNIPLSAVVAENRYDFWQEWKGDKYIWDGYSNFGGALFNKYQAGWREFTRNRTAKSDQSTELDPEISGKKQAISARKQMNEEVVANNNDFDPRIFDWTSMTIGQKQDLADIINSGIRKAASYRDLLQEEIHSIPKHNAVVAREEISVSNLIQAMNSFDTASAAEIDKAAWRTAEQNAAITLAISSY